MGKGALDVSTTEIVRLVGGLQGMIDNQLLSWEIRRRTSARGMLDRSHRFARGGHRRHRTGIPSC
jgi:hypothetical protein